MPWGWIPQSLVIPWLSRQCHHEADILVFFFKSLENYWMDCHERQHRYPHPTGLCLITLVIPLLPPPEGQIFQDLFPDLVKKNCIDIHGSKMMYPNDFGNPQTLPPLPQWGWLTWFWVKCLLSTGWIALKFYYTYSCSTPLSLGLLSESQFEIPTFSQ